MIAVCDNNNRRATSAPNRSGDQMPHTELSDERLAELRAVAKAASPHTPWVLVSEDWDRSVSLRQNLDYGPDIASAEFDGDPEFDDQTRADFEHMAEFDPATVLALLDALADLRAVLDGAP